MKEGGLVVCHCTNLGDGMARLPSIVKGNIYQNSIISQDQLCKFTQTFAITNESDASLMEPESEVAMLSTHQCKSLSP